MPRSIFQFQRFEKFGLLRPLVIAVAVCYGAPSNVRSADAQPLPSRRLPALPPFLDVFRTVHRVTLLTEAVEWTSAVGTEHGLLVRSADTAPEPAVILIHDDARDERRKAFFERAARNLAGIGYAVLVVDLPATVSLEPSGTENPSDDAGRSYESQREQQLARLSAAVRWLRRLPNVFPDRLGVLAWDEGAAAGLELAADQHLQACVLIDGRLPQRVDTATAIQLGHTAVLLINGMASGSLLVGELLAQFVQSLAEAGVEFRPIRFDQARPGFMKAGESAAIDEQAADRAWFEIYEFLGRHVEDADVKRLLAAKTTGAAKSLQPVSSIADLMRAINAPTGVRGQLAESLRQGPDDERAWRKIESRAALITDAAQLLATLRPRKGTKDRWLRHTTDYRDAAATLTAAATHRDLPAARQSLLQLSETCGKCHLDHR